MVHKGAIIVLQGRISRARWAAGQMKSSDQQSRAEPLVAYAWCGAALCCVELGSLSGGLEPASVTP